VVRAEFTDEEAQFIQHLLDWWKEGVPEAKAMTIEDASLGDLEDLLELASGLDSQLEMVAVLKEKLASVRG
jgi:hypothetical protein